MQLTWKAEPVTVHHGHYKFEQNIYRDQWETTEFESINLLFFSLLRRP
jgi:hypothetical protein